MSQSWFYERCDDTKPDIAVRDAIEAIVLLFPCSGCRRVTHPLARGGREINHARVLRIMRKESLLRQLARHFVLTTDSQNGWRRSPNLIKGRIIDQFDQV